MREKNDSNSLIELKQFDFRFDEIDAQTAEHLLSSFNFSPEKLVHLNHEVKKSSTPVVASESQCDGKFVDDGECGYQAITSSESAQTFLNIFILSFQYAQRIEH